MRNPRVYVGTWGKYNSGSIAGGWIGLSDCKDYQDFLRKCRALHKGEHDPEYMIQDTEDFPDGLTCGDWLSEPDFNDVMQACRDEECEDSLDNAIGALMEACAGPAEGAPAPSKPTGDKAMLEEYLAEFEKVWHGDKRMMDYEKSVFSSAVRLENGGLLYFEKPSIECRFCFHDEGPDYEFYKKLTSKEERMRQYFLDQNLSKFDEDIEALKHPESDGRTWYIQRASYNSQTEPLNLWGYTRIDEWDLKSRPSWYGEVCKMSDADRQTILAGLQAERAKFDKRLQTYLKRYGVSKLHTWTYWADA